MEQQAIIASQSASSAAMQRMLSMPGEPLFQAAWENVLMIHYEIDPTALQTAVPFELDLWDGRAFVSLVAFTMRGLRFRRGGPFGAWLLKPIATHEYLNVRTYVRSRTGASETCIYFLAEWLPNRLSVALGPTAFGLPYRLGTIDYSNLSDRVAQLAQPSFGLVKDRQGKGALTFSIKKGASHPDTCEPGSLEEWLMDRYTAFTLLKGRGNPRFFRVWHPPWRRVPATVSIEDRSLLDLNWPFFGDAKFIGASFSRGFEEVWMGRPHRLSLRANQLFP